MAGNASNEMDHSIYSPLGPTHFRLLEILPDSDPSTVKCELRTVSVETKSTSYTALSYTWGDAPPSQHITIGKHSFGVRQNVLDFLGTMVREKTNREEENKKEEHTEREETEQEEREETIRWLKSLMAGDDDKELQKKRNEKQERRTQQQKKREKHERRSLFFIDAICINQEDEEEQGRQVALMGDIYKQASEVIIWLGRPDSDSDQSNVHAFFTTAAKVSPEISSSDRYGGDYREPPKPCPEIGWTPAELNGCKYVCESRFWTRLWIVQECIQAQFATIYCGDSKIRWSNISMLGDETNGKSWNAISGAEMIDARDDYLLSGLRFRLSLVPVKWPRAMLSIFHEKKMNGTDRLSSREKDLSSLATSDRDFKEQTSSTGIPLRQALHHFGSQDCSKRHDKLYGLLSLLRKESRSRFIPDYNRPISEVCAQVYNIGLGEMHKPEIMGTKYPVNSLEAIKQKVSFYFEVTQVFHLSLAELEQFHELSSFSLFDSR